MIINNTHVQGIFVYSPDVEYERGDFVVSGDSIYICTASNPTNQQKFTVKGIDPTKDSVSNFKVYPGDKVSTAKEYYDYVNGRLYWEFKNSAQDVENALGMEPGTFPIENVVTERDALPKLVHEGDAYRIGTPSTGYEYAYIPYHEDKYISGNVLNEILQNTFFGVNEDGVITNYVSSGGFDEDGNEIIEYSIGGSLANIENGKVLDAIMKSPDLNNGMFNVSRSLSEIATLVDRNSEIECVLVKQYTYIDSSLGNRRIRIQEIIDPVIGSVNYRWAEGYNIKSLPYSETRVYKINEVSLYDKKAWISNYSNNSGHTPGNDGYWREYLGEWAYNNITGWVSNYENSSKVILKQLNNIRAYYAKKLQELEATRQQLVGTFCNREVDMNLVDETDTSEGVEYSLESGINVRMHSSWQYFRSSEGDLLTSLRISSLSDALTLFSSSSFVDTYLNPRSINVNLVIKVGTKTNYTYSYHVAGNSGGWTHGKTLNEILNLFGVSDLSDVFETTLTEYNILLSLSPDFPYTVIIKDPTTKDLSISKYLPVAQEWIIGESLIENSELSENITEVNYEDVLYNDYLIRSSSALRYTTANPWLVESGSSVGVRGNHSTISPYLTYISIYGKPIYLARPYCGYNVEYFNSESGERTTSDATDPTTLQYLNSQDFIHLQDYFPSIVDSLRSGYSNSTATVWNYLSLGPSIYLTGIKYNIGSIVINPEDTTQLYKCIRNSDLPFPSISNNNYWVRLEPQIDADSFIPSYADIFDNSALQIIKDATNDRLTVVSFNSKCFHFDAYENNDTSMAVGKTMPNVFPFTRLLCIMYPTIETNGDMYLDLTGEVNAFDVRNSFYALFDFTDNKCYLMRANREEFYDVDGSIAINFLKELCYTLFGESINESTLGKLISSSINETNLSEAISNSLSMNYYDQSFSSDFNLLIRLCSRSGGNRYFVKTTMYQGSSYPIFSNGSIISSLEPEDVSYSGSYSNNSSTANWLGLCGIEINTFTGKLIRLTARVGSDPKSDYNYYITKSPSLENFIYRGKGRDNSNIYYSNANPSTDLIYKSGNYYFLASSSGSLGSTIDTYTEVYNQAPVSIINDTRFYNISISLPEIPVIDNVDDLELVLSSFFPGFYIIVTDGIKYYRYGRGTITDLGTTLPNREDIASYVRNKSTLSSINKYYFPTTLIKYVPDSSSPREYKFAYNQPIERKGSENWVAGKGPITQLLDSFGEDNMAAFLDITDSDVSLQDLMAYKGLSVRVVCKKVIDSVTHFYINGNYWVSGNPPVDDSEYTMPSNYIFSTYHDLPDAFNLGKVRAKTLEGGENSWYVVQNTKGWLDINLGDGDQFYDENLGYYVHPWWTSDRSGYINTEEALHDYLHTCFVVHPNDAHKWIGIVYEPNKTYYSGDEIIWNSKKWKCLTDCTGEEPTDVSDYWVYSGDPIFDALTYLPSETQLLSNVNPTVPFKLVTKVGTESKYFIATNTKSSDFGTTCIATFLIEIPLPGTTMKKTQSVTLDLQIEGQYYVDDNVWLSITGVSNTKRSVLVHGGIIRNIYYRYRI